MLCYVIKKQLEKGCNIISKTFRNPNNKVIKITRRFKEMEWERIFNRPIKVIQDSEIPVWQNDKR